jgi:predicted nucleic acid-binding protein
MSRVRFLDTNILLYAYDLDAPSKREVALRLVEQGWAAPNETAISVQVLQELHVNLERRRIPRSDSVQIVQDYTAWTVVETTLELLQAGLDEQARWQISFWDAMILAAARRAGAHELTTEDLNHGQDYDGITVINPFVKS